MIGPVVVPNDPLSDRATAKSPNRNKLQACNEGNIELGLQVIAGLVLLSLVLVHSEVR